MTSILIFILLQFNYPFCFSPKMENINAATMTRSADSLSFKDTNRDELKRVTWLSAGIGVAGFSESKGMLFSTDFIIPLQSGGLYLNAGAVYYHEFHPVDDRMLPVLNLGFSVKFNFFRGKIDLFPGASLYLSFFWVLPSISARTFYNVNEKFAIGLDARYFIFLHHTSEANKFNPNLSLSFVYKF